MSAPLPDVTPGGTAPHLPWACPTCGRPYCDLSSLQQQAVQKVPFRCPICNGEGSGFFGAFWVSTSPQVCPKCNGERVIWG
jgi:DnaJ-class molecular chaperone